MSRYPIPVLLVLPILLGATPDDASRFRLTRVATSPERPDAPSAEAIEALRAAVVADPKDRAARFALVDNLIRAEDWDGALEAARAWRAVDAYNLVVVRLVGDVLAELGRMDEARRAWSAVAELLPNDPEAHRALATVLKQSGDVEAAYGRLKVARDLRPKDARIAFELADAAARLGRTDEALALFTAIADDDSASKQVRYPASQRAKMLRGDASHDLRVYLSWDTDRTDVDLWVINPAGQKVYYDKRTGKFGGKLFDDVTTGYGPEAFEAETAAKGAYQIQVNYYGTDRRVFSEARGEVVVVLAGQRHVLPYRLFRVGQTVTVARVTVN